MKLGSLSLDNNLILAPMQEVTTGPYRRFCRKFHKIGLVSVPMLYAKRIEKRPKSVYIDLHKIEEERPISVQLIGGEPEALRKAIDFLESYKYDVLDINAGCPSKRAIRAKEGGYLLGDLKQLQQLINITVKYSSRPISLKIRTGLEKPNDVNEIVKIIDDSGINFLIIHARTVKDRFNDSQLDLDFIKKIKELTSIPVIGNGDIISPETAKSFIDYTNVDAIMIGRGTMGKPEIFYQIEKGSRDDSLHSFKNDINKLMNKIEIYKRCIEEFIDDELNLSYSSERYEFLELKRNSIWLSKEIENSTQIRIKISKTKNLKELNTTLYEISNNQIFSYTS